MKTIKISKITGYKKWTTVEVIEGSEEHTQIIHSNKIMNYQNYQNRKEFKRQSEAEENEVSADTAKDINAALNEITKSKFKTDVILRFCSEDEYYAKLEAAIEKNEAAIALQEEYNKVVKK